jgi:DNA repair photolyase
MKLGELYEPKGKAYETAEVVLEVEPMACNVGWGCTNMCSYCFIRYIEKGKMRFPKAPPVDLVGTQLERGLNPKGVFLCFNTDPFIENNKKASIDLINLLGENKIRMATLSKVDLAINFDWKIRAGMTIVSDNNNFSNVFEPNARPVVDRIRYLKGAHDMGVYTWVSVEPFPTPNIFKQDLTRLLNKLSFVDLFVFGKLNYDARANDKEYYAKIVKEFENYCKNVGIRHFVKRDTLEFIDSVKNPSDSSVIIPTKEAKK